MAWAPNRAQKACTENCVSQIYIKPIWIHCDAERTPVLPQRREMVVLMQACCNGSLQRGTILSPRESDVQVTIGLMRDDCWY